MNRDMRNTPAENARLELLHLLLRLRLAEEDPTLHHCRITSDFWRNRHGEPSWNLRVWVTSEPHPITWRAYDRDAGLSLNRRCDLLKTDPKILLDKILALIRNPIQI